VRRRVRARRRGGGGDGGGVAGAVVRSGAAPAKVPKANGADGKYEERQPHELVPHAAHVEERQQHCEPNNTEKGTCAPGAPSGEAFECARAGALNLRQPRSRHGSNGLKLTVRASLCARCMLRVFFARLCMCMCVRACARAVCVC
jgi:hypothetical protein